MSAGSLLDVSIKVRISALPVMEYNRNLCYYYNNNESWVFVTNKLGLQAWRFRLAIDPSHFQAEYQCIWCLPRKCSYIEQTLAFGRQCWIAHIVTDVTQNLKVTVRVCNTSTRPITLHRNAKLAELSQVIHVDQNPECLKPIVTTEGRASDIRWHQDTWIDTPEKSPNKAQALYLSSSVIRWLWEQMTLRENSLKNSFWNTCTQTMSPSTRRTWSHLSYKAQHSPQRQTTFQSSIPTNTTCTLRNI